MWPLLLLLQTDAQRLIYTGRYGDLFRFEGCLSKWPEGSAVFLYDMKTLPDFHINTSIQRDLQVWQNSVQMHSF